MLRAFFISGSFSFSFSSRLTVIFREIIASVFADLVYRADAEAFGLGDIYQVLAGHRFGIDAKYFDYSFDVHISVVSHPPNKSLKTTRITLCSFRFGFHKIWMSSVPGVLAPHVRRQWCR